MDELPTNGESNVTQADSRLSNSLEENPLIESAICFFTSTADGKAGTLASCGKYKF
jgi:hypothetical protein